MSHPAHRSELHNIISLKLTSLVGRNDGGWYRPLEAIHEFNT